MKFLSITVISLAFSSLVFAQSGQRPQGQPPKDGHGGGKPAFVTACSNLSSGASCSFTERGSSYTGTCESKQNPMGQTELICSSDEFEANRPQQ
jgi:hypothetical protein